MDVIHAAYRPLQFVLVLWSLSGSFGLLASLAMALAAPPLTTSERRR